MNSLIILYKNYIIYKYLRFSGHSAITASTYYELTFSTVKCNIKLLCIIFRLYQMYNPQYIPEFCKPLFDGASNLRLSANRTPQTKY